MTRIRAMINNAKCLDILNKFCAPTDYNKFALNSPLDQVFDIGLLYLFKIFDNFDVFRTVQKQSESKVVVFCQRK